MPHPDTNNPSDPEATKTVKLTEKDIRDAARLFRLLADPTVLASGPSGFLPASKASDVSSERETLISRARIVFNSRRLRERYFDKAMFGEPAWDMLLLLYIAEQSLGRLTATRLAEQLEMPLTTVARWLNLLEMEQLVERRAHPTDRRAMFIKLLEKGRSALDSYLGSIPG